MDEPLVSHYELQGDTVVLQMDAVSASSAGHGLAPRLWWGGHPLSGC